MFTRRRILIALTSACAALVSSTGIPVHSRVPAGAAASEPEAAGCSPEGAWARMGELSAPSPRTGASMIWTGSELIVWGGSAGGPLATGARHDPATDLWSPMSSTGAPEARMGHGAVWTGTRMIVWGGYPSGYYNALGTGGSYDPATDTWSPISTTGAPSPRSGFHAVWTGARMIVWGGQLASGGSTSTGGLYDPATDTWTPISLTGAPSARTGHSTVWTGERMIIWGGGFGPGLADGGLYDPATDTWQPISTTGAPERRSQHGAAWAEGMMVIWGGYNGSAYVNTGGVYDPATDSWSATSPSQAPLPRRNPLIVDAGEALMVWGGESLENGAWLDSGALYHPSSDTWSALPAFAARGIAAPGEQSVFFWNGDSGARYDVASARWQSMRAYPIPAPGNPPTGVWTGTEMLIWPSGGTGGRGGQRYDPAADRWRPISAIGAPEPGSGHTAVWTGSRLIVWGGLVWPGGLNTGGVYNPQTDTWSPISTTGAPSPRGSHTAVWTGSRMIVWGGHLPPYNDVLGALGDGGIYDPATDTWSPVPMTGAPSPRTWHSAVWTGTEMIVWGGSSMFFEPDYLVSQFDGGRFNPSTGTWAPLPSSGAPAARFGHRAVWTGIQMILWGGAACVCPGCGGCPAVSTGGRYVRASNAWFPVGTAGSAPAAMSGHTAVWTGSRMIVYGGPGTGGQYSPVSDDWLGVSSVDAPPASGAAFWTGKAMLVWGWGNPGGLFFPNTLVDLDGDGYAICDGDCHDGNASVSPEGIEACNGLDDDCSGIADEAGHALCPDDGNACTVDLCAGARGCTHGDADGDDRAGAACGGTDCDDLNAGVWSPPEDPACDDLDTSWYPNILRCDPQDATAGPGTRFDLVSGLLVQPGAIDFPWSACRYTGSSPLFYDMPVALPPEGTARWWLVRARNGCGASTWGSPQADAELPPCE